jgi:hypothetical protein
MARVPALQNRTGIYRSVAVKVSLAYMTLCLHPVWGAVDVLVGRFDPSGTGANLRETALTNRSLI